MVVFPIHIDMLNKVQQKHPLITTLLNSVALEKGMVYRDPGM